MPAWLCPTCDVGTLREAIKDRIKIETGYSKLEHSEDYWEPEFIINRFCSKMICTNPTCGEVVLVIGRGDVESYYDDEGTEWSDIFVPSATFPAVPMFRISDDWPPSVSHELKLSFGSIWSDAGASANRLRTAVEHLLDHLAVKKTTLSKSGGKSRRVRLPLHDRIIAFKQKNSVAADLLLAIKWLGNAGSHANSQAIARDDVLDGMEIMEHVMHLLFDKQGANVSKLAKSINRKRGPIKRSKKIPKIF